jgi:hypothetical protein
MRKRGEKTGVFYDKKGQITIFIIIAVVIVAIGVLVYIFYPQISSTLSGQQQDPASFIQSCMEGQIKDAVDKVSMQGGSMNPEPYILYQNEKIQYLCYAEGYYQLCGVQKPLLEKQIERELKNATENEAKNCFNEMKSSFEQRGYTVTMREGDISVNLLPGKILSTYNYTVTLERTETQRYESFNVILDNNLYELAGIANSIIDGESTYGDTEKSLYTDMYHNITIEKMKPEYGTKVYIITDSGTGNKFQFASRSLVVPPGYGTSVV